MAQTGTRQIPKPLPEPVGVEILPVIVDSHSTRERCQIQWSAQVALGWDKQVYKASNANWPPTSPPHTQI